MIREIGKRILWMLAMMLVLSFVTFSLMQLSPVDPVTLKFQIQGANYDAEAIAAMQKSLGLDRPFLEQYGMWLGRMLQGELGESILLAIPVGEILKTALPRTLALVGAATAVGLVVSILLGYMSAIYKHTWIDYVIRGLSFIGISWPSFWLGLLIIYIAAVELQWSSIIDGDSAVTFIGATLTLSIWFSGLYIRRFRAILMEELNKDYMKAAYILGVSRYKRIVHYLLPNASLTVLPMLGLSVGSMLAGSTVIEAIFGWRGIGYYMVSGIISRDYPVIQAYVLYVSFIFIMITLCVDIAVIALDPRRRRGGEVL